MKNRKYLSFLLSVIALFCTTQLWAQVAGPAVVTDKDDYAPGSTVLITASGFQPNETIEFQVVHIDGKPDIDPSHLPWQVVADAEGNAQTTWEVSSDNIDSTLQLTATGLTSGLTAQTVFTDSVSITRADASISADTAANSPTPSWMTLGPISIAEAGGASGQNDFSTGTGRTLILKAPTGFEFNTNVTPNILVVNSPSDISSPTVAITNSSTILITFNVNGTSRNDTLRIGSTTGIQVRPTAATPLASGSIYRPATAGGNATIDNIDTASNTDGSDGTSFGNLTQIAGTVKRLAFTTQVAGATAGAAFSTQPVVKSQDQFGNDSVAGLPSTLNVTLALTAGTGPVQGTLTKNIGTSGTDGVGTFTGLRIDVAGSDKQFTATATGLTNAVGGTFTVSPGSANKLVIQTQPSSTASAGLVFAQQPVIRIEDAFGNFRSSDTLAITAARNGGAGTLQGTTVINAVGGVATFTNLSHNLATNITIQFTSGVLTSATSGTVAVSAGTFSKLLVVMPGETFAPGTTTGKTGTPTAQTAGTAFNVTVYAVDAGWNLISTNDSVAIDCSDANAVLPIDAALVGGTKTFSVTCKTSGATTITASDVTNGSIASGTGSNTVNTGAFVKLQLLMPGETAAPGTAPGKTGTPTALTAGTVFNVIVNGVDANWNVVATANGSAYTMHLASTDANATMPANADLSSGSRTFSVTLKTAGSVTITATDVDDGTKTASSSPVTTVNPGAFVKLQLLVPGETAAPGTTTGKTGTPSAKNTDASFNVTVNAVDANWNLVNTNHTIAITSSDPNATLPANTALSGGTESFSMDFNTAGSRTITAMDVTDGTKTASTSPSITVSVGAFARLQVLMPGQTAAPGTATGKTGTPTAQTAGTAFNVTVNAVDGDWNLISTNDTVAITSSDVSAVLPANAALTSGSKTYSVTFKAAGSATVTAANVTHAGIASNTGSSTTVNSGAFAKLQLLVPGETAAPGSAAGKTGSPSTQNRGTPFFVTVNSVDANWNVINTNDVIRITSSDTNAVLPANSALVAGTKTFSITLQTTNGSATVTASNVTHTGIASGTSPSITVPSIQSQTITFNAPGNKIYGDAPFNVSATASSGLPVSFSIVSGPATIAGDLITITGAGDVVVRASQAGNGSYSAATNVDRSFTIAKATLTINVDNQHRLYGQDNPEFTGTVTGIKYADDITVTYHTGLDAESPVGVYPFSIYTQFEDPDDKLANYDVHSNNGRLIIDALPTEWTVSNGGNGHFYQAIFAPEGIDWNIAQSNAVALGGYLVTITSSNENAFAFSLVSSNLTYWAFDSGESLGPWLGAVQEDGSTEPAGGWGWITGEPFTYQNWGPNQPNEDIPFGQDRIQFLSMTSQPNSLWNDLQHDGMFNGDTFVKSYIIEYNSDPSKTNQSITFDALADKTYGDAPFNPTASASSGLSVSLSIVSGPATLDGNTLTIIGAGTVTVRATQEGNSSFNAANPVELSFIVGKAASSMVVTSSANPAAVGASITFTATVGGVTAPTGTIQFKADGSPLGAPVVLAAGVATVDTASLTHGSHTITAEYAGDANFLGTTNSMATEQLINSAPVTRAFTVNTIVNTPVNVSTTKLLKTVSDVDADGVTLVSVGATSANNGTVSLVGSTITYSPPVDSTAVDAFTYQVHDGHGGTNTGTVTVIIKSSATAQAPSQNLLSMHTSHNNHKIIRFAGIPGRTYTVQASTNLTTWTTIGTAAAGSNGLFQFEDVDAESFPSRYYRTTQ